MVRPFEFTRTWPSAVLRSEIVADDSFALLASELAARNPITPSTAASVTSNHVDLLSSVKTLLSAVLRCCICVILRSACSLVLRGRRRDGFGLYSTVTVRARAGVRPWAADRGAMIPTLGLDLRRAR